MEQEIKRLAISQFTREFDVQASDDQVSQFETMGEMPVGAFRYPSLSITPGDENAPATAATFDAPDRRITGYATADVGLSRLKGAHIQFIEHAFEWTQLSFVFYPYYWATPPKWIELLDREDDADPQFTDFLQVEDNSLAARDVLLDKYQGWIGSRWWILSNPTYGGWEGAAINNAWSLPADLRNGAKREALEVAR